MHACKFGRGLRLFWDWGPTDHKNVSSFTLSYGLPEPSMEPSQGIFHPTFLAEILFYLLCGLFQLVQALLRPPSGLSDTPFVPLCSIG